MARQSFSLGVLIIWGVVLVAAGRTMEGTTPTSATEIDADIQLTAEHVRNKRLQPEVPGFYADPKREDSGVFWGNRGKRLQQEPPAGAAGSSLVELDVLLRRLEFAALQLEQADLYQKCSNRSKREDEPFWGNRGRRNNEDDAFWGNRGKRQQRPGELDSILRRFDRVKAKLERLSSYTPDCTDFDLLWGDRNRRNGDETKVFWGNRGRRNELPLWMSRGKKDDGKELSNRGKKDPDEPLFWGNRGKKSQDIFWGNRGRRSDDAEEAFWGSRGKRSKRSSDDMDPMTKSFYNKVILTRLVNDLMRRTDSNGDMEKIIQDPDSGDNVLIYAEDGL